MNICLSNLSYKSTFCLMFEMRQLLDSTEYLVDRRVDIVGMQLQIIQLGLSESNPTQFLIVMLQPF